MKSAFKQAQCTGLFLAALAGMLVSGRELQEARIWGAAEAWTRGNQSREPQCLERGMITFHLDIGGPLLGEGLHLLGVPSIHKRA